MNNAKKFLKVSAAVGLFSLCGVLLSTTLNASPNVVNASEVTENTRTWTADDFKNETEISDDYFSAAITQVNSTDTSLALKVKFSSTSLVGFTNAGANYVIRIDDTNFTGKKDDPVGEDFDRYNDDHIPILDGTVVAIFKGGFRFGSENVYIPAVFTYLSKLQINVTGIATGSITDTGTEDFNNDNIWSKQNDPIKNIYLPSSLQTVESGAFGNVPEDVTIHLQGDSIPTGYASDWATGIKSEQVKFNAKHNHLSQIATTEYTLKDAEGRPWDVSVGYYPNEDWTGDEYYKPLVVQYDIVSKTDNTETGRTIYRQLPRFEDEEDEEEQEQKEAWDVIGPSSVLSDTIISIDLAENETIDTDSIIFHNIYRLIKEGNKKSVIDLNKPYNVKAKPLFERVLPISDLLIYKSSHIAKFVGYSIFSFNVDLNYGVVSEQFPEPHSLYLDVKTEMYLQNKTALSEGKAYISYFLENLYQSYFSFEYKGKNGQIKTVTKKIDAEATYQELSKEKGNVVSLLVRDSDIAPDFKAENVTKFTLKELNIVMRIMTISDSGTHSKLGKSDISYRYGDLVVFNKDAGTMPAPFDFNIFAIIFYVAYLVVYAAAALGLHKYMKNKYKNDEFRRVNTKKFFKTAGIGCGGLALFLTGVLSIVLRTTAFNNSIIVFNPLDPFVIVFSIFGAIAFGYFVVAMVKRIKTEISRREIVRLKLNEDKDDDGTK